jgi:hypothetical protein
VQSNADQLEDVRHFLEEYDKNKDGILDEEERLSAARASLEKRQSTPSSAVMNTIHYTTNTTPLATSISTASTEQEQDESKNIEQSQQTTRQMQFLSTQEPTDEHAKTQAVFHMAKANIFQIKVRLICRFVVVIASICVACFILVLLWL